MRILPLSLLAACVWLSPISTKADEASHAKAAEALLEKMDMKTMMSQATDQMLQAQVKQNPGIAPFLDEMTAFMNKYMGWDSLKEGMVKIYAEEFSEEELKGLSAFYETPLGKKSLQKMPQLMAKGAALGQQKVQEHMPELQAAIEAKAKASAAAPKTK